MRPDMFRAAVGQLGRLRSVDEVGHCQCWRDGLPCCRCGDDSGDAVMPVNLDCAKPAAPCRRRDRSNVTVRP